MRRTITAWLAVLAGVTVAACGTGPSGGDPAVGGGVAGVVVAGPGCPVSAEPTDVGSSSPQSSCPAAPVQADVHVRDMGSGRDVTTVRTAPDGHFTIALDAGQYELQVVDPATGSESGPPEVVAVSAEKLTETTLIFDTGIR